MTRIHESRVPRHKPTDREPPLEPEARAKPLPIDDRVRDRFERKPGGRLFPGVPGCPLPAPVREVPGRGDGPPLQLPPGWHVRPPRGGIPRRPAPPPPRLEPQPAPPGFPPPRVKPMPPGLEKPTPAPPVKPPVIDDPAPPRTGLDDARATLDAMRGTPAARDPALVKELLARLDGTKLETVGRAAADLVDRDPAMAGAAFDLVDSALAGDGAGVEDAMYRLERGAYGRDASPSHRPLINDLRQAMLETLSPDQQRAVMRDITDEPLYLANNATNVNPKIDASGFVAGQKQPTFDGLYDFAFGHVGRKSQYFLLLDTTPLSDAFANAIGGGG